jgi:small-conductance mechanosensitive channel
MSGEVDIQVLVDLIRSVQQFGERLVVQRQLAAFALVMIASWIISHVVWFLVGKRVEAWVNNRLTGRLQRHLQYEVSIVHHIFLPSTAIVGLDVVNRIFLLRGWHAGLLSMLTVLLWAMMGYRLFVGVLYAKLGENTMKRYHNRFIAPLFGVLVAAWLVNNLIPLRRLAEIKLWDGFTDPITLGSLLVATLGFYFWYDGSGVMQDMLHSLIAPRTAADPGTVEASLTIGRYIVICIGLFMVFTVLGFDSTMLAFATGGLSVGIGFGSKELVSNLISGVLLLFDQSLRPGDIVSIDGQMGIVKQIGIRATNVNTLNNVEMLIPNQTFLTTSVTTYTKSDRLVRILIPFDVANRHTPPQVRDAALAAVAQHPLVATNPAPDVFFLGNGDTSFLYELAVWCDDPMRTKALTSDLYYMMFDEFEKRGLEPPTPQRDLQLINNLSWTALNKLMKAAASDLQPQPESSGAINGAWRN